MERVAYGSFHELLGNIGHEMAFSPASVKRVRISVPDFYASGLEAKFFVENIIVRIVRLFLGHLPRPFVFLRIVRDPFDESVPFAMRCHVPRSTDNNFQFVGQTYRAHVNVVMRKP